MNRFLTDLCEPEQPVYELLSWDLPGHRKSAQEARHERHGNHRHAIRPRSAHK